MIPKFVGLQVEIRCAVCGWSFSFHVNRSVEVSPGLLIVADDYVQRPCGCGGDPVKAPPVLVAITPGTPLVERVKIEEKP